MFLVDLWRQQTSSNVWIEAWCDLVTKWKPAFWAEAKTQITSGVGPFITARARERQAYTKREQFPTRCSDGACRERHWCRQLFERGLSHRGLPLKRKFRVLRQDQSRSAVYHE